MITVIVRRAECSLGNGPPRREDDEIGDGHAITSGRASQDSENRRIL